MPYACRPELYPTIDSSDILPDRLVPGEIAIVSQRNDYFERDPTGPQGTLNGSLLTMRLGSIVVEPPAVRNRTHITQPEQAVPQKHNPHSLQKQALRMSALTLLPGILLSASQLFAPATATTQALGLAPQSAHAEPFCRIFGLVCPSDIKRELKEPAPPPYNSLDKRANRGVHNAKEAGKVYDAKLEASRQRKAAKRAEATRQRAAGCMEYGGLFGEVKNTCGNNRRQTARQTQSNSTGGGGGVCPPGTKTVIVGFGSGERPACLKL